MKRRLAHCVLLAVLAAPAAHGYGQARLFANFPEAGQDRELVPGVFIETPIRPYGRCIGDPAELSMTLNGEPFAPHTLLTKRGKYVVEVTCVYADQTLGLAVPFELDVLGETPLLFGSAGEAPTGADGRFPVAAGVPLRRAPAVDEAGTTFVARPKETTIFQTAKGVVVLVPPTAFSVDTQIRVDSAPTDKLQKMMTEAEHGVSRPFPPPGLVLADYLAIDFEGEAAASLHLYVPAPPEARDGIQVFFGQLYGRLSFLGYMAFVAQGGVVTRLGRRYLADDPAVQPELEGGVCDPALRDQDGCFIESALFGIRRPGKIAVLYESSPESWVTIAVRDRRGFAFEFGFYRLRDDQYWNHVTSLRRGWNFYYLVPANVNEPLIGVLREYATSWPIYGKPLIPLAAAQGLVLVRLAPFPAREPALAGARPFRFASFHAPPPGKSREILPGVQATSELDAEGISLATRVHGVPGHPLADHTWVQVVDMEPRELKGKPEVLAELTVCGDGETWTSPPVPGSEHMYVVVAPGELGPADYRQIELAFEQSLQPIDDSKGPAAQLFDLGEIGRCGDQLPRSGDEIPVRADLVYFSRNLRIEPFFELPAGHRFRLQLHGQALAVKPGERRSTTLSLPLWPSLETFEFATRPDR